MKNDALKIILVLLTTIVVIYGMPRFGIPHLFTQLVFLLLIFYVFRSKDDVFWLTWLFIIMNAPGRLFNSTYGADIYRLPLYTLAPGISVGFDELLLVAYIIKLSTRRSLSVPFLFRKQIWGVIALGAAYFGISFAIGISFPNIIRTFREISHWAWVLIIPQFFNSEEDVHRFYKMMIPMVIFTFATIIQAYLTGTYLDNILARREVSRLIEASEDSLARVSTAAFINFLVLVISLYYLSIKKTIVNQNLAITMSFLSSLSIFLSATRGWILAILILYSSFLFISGFGFVRQLFRVVAIVSLMSIIIIGIYPLISVQASLSMQRFLTLGDLAQGDLTLGGTLSRMTERGPRVMAIFQESPVIGWGFSDRFYTYADIHVGNQTNLLNLGVLGYFILLLLFLSICYVTYVRGRRNRITYNTGNSHYVFLFSLLALYIAHSTSGMLWGYGYVSSAKTLMWAVLIASINIALSHAPTRKVLG